MNLLMISPLRDSKGEVRYHIGAQVDVSGIVKECTDLESLRRLVLRDEAEAEAEVEPKKDAFQELSEMFNMHELETVRRFGGRMHKEMEDVDVDVGVNTWHRPRLLLSDPSPETLRPPHFPSRFGGELSGVYKNYLLVRPYPSLRVLFASPSLRVPGILQSPFLAKIGGSARVRDELTKALAEGRGVTAKVRWQSRGHEEGRNRWIHCTPLVGADSKIGVWMVVIVDDDDDDDDDHDAVRRQRVAPPVDPNLGRSRQMVSERQMMSDREMESEQGDFPLRSRRDQPLARSRSPPVVHVYNERASIESRCFPDLDVELNVDRPRSANSSRQPDPLLNPL
ncbi:MAG: hypothetical protein M1815_002024 [Lichina confinis]|nr:MAG: hypothetical protein M1815_002024 [Lichina confinis]